MYLLVLKYKMVDKISIGIGLITWFSYQNAMRTGFPVMKTGFSLSEKLHKENPVFITRMVFMESNVYCFKDAILICNLNIFSCFQNNYYIELQNCKRLDQKK